MPTSVPENEIKGGKVAGQVLEHDTRSLVPASASLWTFVKILLFPYLCLFMYKMLNDL